jgi:hypothetical protein
MTAAADRPAIPLILDMVPPGETHIVEDQSKIVATYDTIVIETYDGFEVCGITVNGEPQLVTDTPVPAVAFSPGAMTGVRLSFSAPDLPAGPMPLGTRFGLKVRNVSEQPRPFQAKFVAS